MLSKRIVLDEVAKMQLHPTNVSKDTQKLIDHGYLPETLTIRMWTGTNVVMFAYELDDDCPDVVKEAFKRDYYFNRGQPEFRTIATPDDLIVNKQWEFNYFLEKAAENLRKNSHDYDWLFPEPEDVVVDA